MPAPFASFWFVAPEATTIARSAISFVVELIVVFVPLTVRSPSTTSEPLTFTVPPASAQGEGSRVRVL